MSYLCLAESLLSITLATDITGNKKKCEIACVDTDSSERTGWDGEEERDCLVLLCGVMGSVHSSWVRSREGWPKWACYASTNIFHIFIKFADSVGILHSLSSLPNF